MITWTIVNAIKIVSLAFFALGFVNLFPALKESPLIKKIEPLTEPLLKAVRNYLPEGSFDLSYWAVSGALYLLALIIHFFLKVLF